jgi:hypothetical protein
MNSDPSQGTVLAVIYATRAARVEVVLLYHLRNWFREMQIQILKIQTVLKTYLILMI